MATVTTRAACVVRALGPELSTSDVPVRGRTARRRPTADVDRNEADPERTTQPARHSPRTILNWVQTFGRQLAAEVRCRRRVVGKRWFVDEVFLFRNDQKHYRYRAIDEDGVVVDILLRGHRSTAGAEAFFRQAIERTKVIPTEVVTDHHQPYIKAVATTCPGALHIRTGLHCARGGMTKAVERSHVPTRDRLRTAVA